MPSISRAKETKSILPGDDMGVVKRTFRNELSDLMCPQLQSDGTVFDQTKSVSHVSKAHE